jgi:hypothetical protein
VEYQCIKSMAETEIYMGEKSIKKLILKWDGGVIYYLVAFYG